MIRPIPAFAFCLAILITPSTHGEDAQPPAIRFERDIQPIFENHCLRCHGEKRRRGGVLLTTRKDVLLPGDSGKRPVVPGESEHSELIRRLATNDEAQRMPPSGEPLNTAQIALLRRWINEGAVWAESKMQSKHWAYVKPQRPVAPAVSDASWPRNAVDYFVLARLDQEGLRPSPPLERERLIRRVYLDLIGLPPTIEQVDAFVSDSRPDAYERVVDELLTSPHYGEHWARHWLDLARYADSNGYQRDGFRIVWPYRDWVVQAFNNDMPFDQFTIEQIAGDLIPGATLEQKLATGFSRCTTVNVEAGTDQEEDRVSAVFDRVNTMATVWLGTSMTCAQCHNHKYDPFTQLDYYRLFAYFNSTPMETDGGKSATRQFIGPKMSLPEIEEQRARRLKLEAERSSLEKFIEVQTSLWAASKQVQAEIGIRKNAKEFKKMPADLRRVLDLSDDARTEEEKEELTTFLADRDPEIAKLRTEMNGLEAKIKNIEPPSTLVMMEMDTQRASFVFKRGDFLKKGEPVQPGVPEALHELPGGAPANRLGLGRWLVSEDNPLVGRVTANRWWANFFGRGLVESVEDFGSQCTPPTHPELLDWLACEFQQGGWSMKKMHRLIVTSATYMQSSRATAELKLDPNNRLLARGPRLRLEAEAIRDNALSIAGLLGRKLGGPPVMPPQPEGVWNVTGAVDNTYRPSAGPDRFRRGLYTVWRRSSPYPSFVAFDAPDRAACVVNRPRTNTPLQALTLMNDPVYLEAALGLGRRMMTHDAESVADRLAFGFRLCVARTPDSREVALLQRVYEEALLRYRAEPSAAGEVLRYWTGSRDANAAEWAAWFQAAAVLLNLDETITKG